MNSLWVEKQVGDSSCGREIHWDEFFEIRIALKLLKIALRAGLFFVTRLEFNGFS